MKLPSIFAVALLSMSFSTGFGRSLEDYLKSRYELHFVENMPAQVQSRILVISTRYFKPEENYSLKRGLQPRYKMFLFIAGLIGDQGYIKPLKNISEATQYLPSDRDFLVYVDGHGKTFEQALERGFELNDRFTINMVVFDWPTDYMALRKTVHNADEVAANFVIAMRELDVLHEKYYHSSAVSAVFHSMGNHILQNITNPHLISHMPQNLFNNIILNAAAVRQHNHAKWLEKLTIQERIYITVNDEDRTLQGAKILRMAQQLGLGYRGSMASNARYVNFSNIATIEHNLFLGKSQIEKNNLNIYHFYDLAFHGKEVQFTDNTGFQIFNPSDINFLFSFR